MRATQKNIEWEASGGGNSLLSLNIHPDLEVWVYITPHLLTAEIQVGQRPEEDFPALQSKKDDFPALQPKKSQSAHGEHEALFAPHLFAPLLLLLVR